ncbi:MAG: hypothetical protein VX258_02425 [Pseudomonadota bacterium]|nr:hypothetical protein [Alcanivorax sp.]MEE3319521.1 hypothetical protein [Pseudomonadota bacterium]
MNFFFGRSAAARDKKRVSKGETGIMEEVWDLGFEVRFWNIYLA